METCSLLCLPVGRLQPVVLVEDEPKTPEAIVSLLVSRSDAEDICWQRGAINFVFAHQLFCLVVLLIDSCYTRVIHCV